MARLRTLLILIHRYLGIPLSAVFVVWFVSGIVMMYAGGMPSLDAALRLERLAPLDLSRVALSPAEAAARSGAARGPAAATLVTVLGRPAYRLGGAFGRTDTVFADNGAALDPLDTQGTRAVAADFLGLGEDALAFVRRVAEPDQWTLALGRELPLDKFAADDGAGTEVYVSPATAEVALVTTRRTRALAWAGTIPHWFYVTPLRVNQPLWYDVVVWTSVLGCMLAVLGLVLGVTQLKPTRPFELSKSIPYRGWMRWHYVTGSIFGVLALTWVFSGLMSMEPFEWTRASGHDVPRNALAGGRPDLDALPGIDVAALERAAGGRALKELQWTTVLGDDYYVARVAPAGTGERPERQHQPYPLAAGIDGNELLIDARTGRPRTAPFAADAIAARLAASIDGAAIVEQTLLTDYDAYYYSRNGTAPLPVLRFELDDPDATWVYADPARGELVALTHRSSRIERWLFNGLHSLDFAFWYDRRPLWDIGMIVLSLGALATSGIGLYLGLRRLRRDARRLLRMRS